MRLCCNRIKTPFIIIKYTSAYWIAWYCFWQNHNKTVLTFHRLNVFVVDEEQSKMCMWYLTKTTKLLRLFGGKNYDVWTVTFDLSETICGKWNRLIQFGEPFCLFSDFKETIHRSMSTENKQFHSIHIDWKTKLCNIIFVYWRLFSAQKLRRIFFVEVFVNAVWLTI